MLEHKLYVIAVTETKLHSEISITNIDIDGYIFEHTPTDQLYREVGICIKDTLDFVKVESLSKVITNVGYSVFIEITSIKKKCFLVVYTGIIKKN